LDYFQEKKTTEEITRMINTPAGPYFKTAIEVCYKSDVLNIEAAKLLLSMGANPNYHCKTSHKDSHYEYNRQKCRDNKKRMVTKIF
jgi:hypothetical protein